MNSPLAARNGREEMGGPLTMCKEPMIFVSYPLPILLQKIACYSVGPRTQSYRMLFRL